MATKYRYIENIDLPYPHKQEDYEKIIYDNGLMIKRDFYQARGELEYYYKDLDGAVKLRVVGPHQAYSLVNNINKLLDRVKCFIAVQGLQPTRINSGFNVKVPELSGDSINVVVHLGDNYHGNNTVSDLGVSAINFHGSSLFLINKKNRPSPVVKFIHNNEVHDDFNDRAVVEVFNNVVWDPNKNESFFVANVPTSSGVPKRIMTSLKVMCVNPIIYRRAAAILARELEQNEKP